MSNGLFLETEIKVPKSTGTSHGSCLVVVSHPKESAAGTCRRAGTRRTARSEAWSVWAVAWGAVLLFRIPSHLVRPRGPNTNLGRQHHPQRPLSVGTLERGSDHHSQMPTWAPRPHPSPQRPEASSSRQQQTGQLVLGGVTTYLRPCTEKL